MNIINNIRGMGCRRFLRYVNMHIELLLGAFNFISHETLRFSLQTNEHGGYIVISIE